MIINEWFQKLHISIEGKTAILAAAGIALLLCILIPQNWALFVLLFLFFPFFFRDPPRDIPDNPNVIVSPADGRVTDIETACLDGTDGLAMRRIGIFLSVFDVHVQRFPYCGTVEKVEYSKGQFHAAFSQKAATNNESNSVYLKTENGPMVVRQIAGLIARRIVCNAAAEKKVVKGDRLGIIMFGSRVEILIPEHMDVLVHTGDRVRAGETIVGLAS